MVIFNARILFFGIFFNFQRFALVRSAPMIDKKPSGGVLYHYCHNPRHVRWIVGSCKIGIEGFNMLMNH